MATIENTKGSSSGCFGELSYGFCTAGVITRLIHIWETTNHRHDPTPIGMEMLLVYKRGDTIQASMSHEQIQDFRPMLHAGNIYSINNFIVVKARSVCRISDNRYSIKFTSMSTLQKKAELSYHIPDQVFRLKTVEELTHISDQNTDLFDVIGFIRVVLPERKNENLLTRTEGRRAITDQEKISLTLEMESGDAIRATLWDATAINFRKRWTTLERKPHTMLLTTMNPKTIRGAINLHSTDATRLFFDNDVHDTRDFRRRLRDRLEDAVLLGSPSKIPKIEVVTIAELKAFTRGGTRQTATFQCVAEVYDVIGQGGWFYISYPRCQTRKIISGAVLLCANEACGSEEAIGVPRFRFELVVRDNTGIATFTVTDYVGQTLAGVSASNLVEQLIGESGGTHNLRFTPQTLLAIIGDQYTFQIRVSPDPIDVESQTVAVTRLIGIERQQQ